MEMIKHLVFVYGTLKEGRGNHRLLRTSKYLGNYKIGPEFTLYVRGLPFLTRNEGDGAIGEVYEITDSVLDSVDHLEGHPNFYTREKVKVTNEKNEELEVWTYVYYNKLDPFNCYKTEEY